MNTIQESWYIVESKKRCLDLGMDPKQPPVHHNFLSSEQLVRKKAEYHEILSVVNFFMDKTLKLMQGTPIVFLVTDENAVVLAIAGDEEIKRNASLFGIAEGLVVEEDLTGTNCATLALKLRQPIALIGTNHYQEALHNTACYAVPFQYTDVNQLLGSISIMTAVQLQHPTLMTMLCTMVDSIERELLLRKQNRRLHMLNQLMIDSTRNGIIVADTEGKVLECNDFAYELLNLDKETVFEHNIHEWEAVGHLLYEATQNGKTIQDRELCIERSGKPRTICLFDTFPIYDENSILIGAYGQLRDITESYEAKELAIKANHAKSDFLSAMSHELRTPLNAILGFAQLLEVSVEPSHQEDVWEILKAGNHLFELVNEILDLSRIETKQMNVALSAVDIHALIEECLSLIQPISADRKIGLYCALGVGPKQVTADRTRLKQVLINLLTNAIKYNEHGGSVHISSETRGSGRLRINVADSGCGISESDQARIFRPFERLPQHGSIEGTGIGLTITKQLVELMGGTMGVQSEVGKGSLFWFELGLAESSSIMHVQVN